MAFKIGDQVIFINQVGGGRITRIGDGEIFVEDQDGFELACLPAELMLKKDTLDFLDWVDTERIDAIVAADLERLKKSAKRPRRDAEKQSADEVLEVDLHIHELVEANAHLSNYQMVQIQMAHFNRMMAHAAEHRLKSMVFIHGVGQGVLKQELRNALDFFPDCSYRDGDFRKYGQGATEVSFRYN